MALWAGAGAARRISTCAGLGPIPNRSTLLSQIRRFRLSAPLFEVSNPQCVAFQERDPCRLQGSSHCR